jgi:A/G-specific adenine glycosylase
MRWTPRLKLADEALPRAMRKVLVHALGDIPKAPPAGAAAPEP